MSENKSPDANELLSSVLDGEASEFELRRVLKDIEANSQLKGKWQQYQTIGAICRKEISSGVDISGSISTVIDKESWAQPKSKGRIFGALRQFAVAASVAAIALVGVNQYQLASNDVNLGHSVAENSASNEPQSAELSNGFSLQNIIDTRNIDTREVSDTRVQRGVQGSKVTTAVDREQIKTHLEDLIQEHSENAAGTTQDTLPIVRAPVKEEGN